MTVAATTPINSYVGSGSANTFPFTFPVFTSAQLLVKVTNTSASPQTVTTLILGVDYTVSGLNATGAPASTGSIVLISAGQAWLSGGNLATGFTLTVSANLPYAQNTSFRDQGDFFRSSIEDALDNLEYQIQQLAYQITLLQSGGTIVPNILIADLSNGHTYQLVMSNGIFGTLQVS